MKNPTTTKLIELGMAQWSNSKEFIIVTDDWNSEKGRKYFGQSEAGWNDEVVRASQAGFKIVLPKYDTKPYVRYGSGKPPIPNVLRIKTETYNVPTITKMTWTQIMAAVLKDINERRRTYNKVFAKQFYYVEKASIKLDGYFSFKYQKSPKQEHSFMRLRDGERYRDRTFVWKRAQKDAYDSNQIATGWWDKLELRGKAVILHGDYLWASEHESRTAKFRAHLLQAVIPTIPMLDEITCWQEVEFNPIPLIKEPAIGASDKLSPSAAKRQKEEADRSYAEHC